MSPDGRTAAYIASSNGKTGLWIRSLDGAGARFIAGTEGASYPFWSLDGRSLAFFTISQLQRVDTAGGPPFPICNMPQTGRGGVWTSDGRIVFGTLSSGLFEVPVTGGTPSRLTTLDASRGEGYHRWPQVLPGGRLLYFVQSGKPENTGVYSVSPGKSGPPVRVLPTQANAVYTPGGDGKDYLLWMRGTALVAQELDSHKLQLTGEPRLLADPIAANGSLGAMNLSASPLGLLLYSGFNSLSQFTWFDRTGKSLGAVGEPGEYSMFRLSPDARRVAVTREQSADSDLWVFEVERRGASRLTLDPGSKLYPVWSPDGRTVVFSSSSPRNLFRTESSGTGDAQRVFESPVNQYATDWSRDGRWILYYEIAPETGRDLGVIPMTADGKLAPGAAPKLLLRTPFSEAFGRFSPELSPRWVAYESDVTGRHEIYVQSFPEAHGRTQISTAGGRFPQWGAGGRELFYVSPDNKLMVVSLKPGADLVEPSAPRELFPLPIADIGLSPYEVAPDGQRFLVRATPGQAGQPLTVIVNWPALLKKTPDAQ